MVGKKTLKEYEFTRLSQYFLLMTDLYEDGKTGEATLMFKQCDKLQRNKYFIYLLNKGKHDTLRHFIDKNT